MHHNHKFTTIIIVFIFIVGNFINLIAHAEQKMQLSEAQICKAAIGTIMGRDPATMVVTKYQDNVVHLYYVRQNDNSKWDYRCKVSSNQIIWAPEIGRWRTDPKDDPVFFTINKDSITIVEKYNDGSTNTKTFKSSQIEPKM